MSDLYPSSDLPSTDDAAPPDAALAPPAAPHDEPAREERARHAPTASSTTSAPPPDVETELPASREPGLAAVPSEAGAVEAPTTLALADAPLVDIASLKRKSVPVLGFDRQ